MIVDFGRARFEDRSPRRAARPSVTDALARAEIVHRYFRMLQATHEALRRDTEAVLAQGSQARAHARRRSGAARS